MSVPKYCTLGGRYPRGLIVHVSNRLRQVTTIQGISLYWFMKGYQAVLKKTLIDASEHSIQQC